MGITERREKEKKQMEALILETAIKLFLEKGFENVSIRRIAEQIEYSPATIYLYYKDKSEILYALQTIGFEKLFEEQLKIVSIEDPWQRLREHARVYVEFSLKNPELYDLMFIMRGPIKKMKETKTWESGMRSYALLQENIKACMEAGYLKQDDLDIATFAFWSVTHGIASLIIRERVIMYPEEHLKAIVEKSLGFVMESVIQKK